jgi:hypothetical protein
LLAIYLSSFGVVMTVPVPRSWPRHTLETSRRRAYGAQMTVDPVGNVAAATTDAVGRLLDIEAIKQLKARYFGLMDQKLWSEWGEVFTADAAMSDFVEWPPDENGARVGITGYGHYVEEYSHEEGTWRIANTRLERLRVDPLD